MKEKQNNSKISHFFFKHKRKLIYFSLVSAIVGIGIGSYFAFFKDRIYFSSNNENKKSKKTQDLQNSVDVVKKTSESSVINLLEKQDIFSNVNAEDFYKYVRIYNGKISIDEELVAAFVKDQVSKLPINAGSLTYEYFYPNENTIKIRFTWLDDNNVPIFKTWDFSADGL